MDIRTAVDIAQIATAIITLAGVSLSFWFARKTLLEVQRDRIYGQRPYLVFKYGGHVISIVIEKNNDGTNSIKPYWPKINDHGGIHVPKFGHLKNFGAGPAIDIEITWIVEEVQIKGEKFKIDDEKKKERQYSPQYNTNPLYTSHLPPNQETGLHLIPRFISSDSNKKIERADGHFIITYQDTFGNPYITKQKFHVFTNYDDLNKEFHTTFSDLIKDEND